MRPRFKLWMSSDKDEGVFGDGKWRLLQAVGRAHSLTGAAQETRMSYRKAWGDLKKAERCLGVALIERRRGGRSGGNTELTEAGRRWVRSYTQFRADVEKAMTKAFRKHMAGLL